MKLLTEANIFRGIFCIYVLLIHCTGTPSRELDPFSLSSMLYFTINAISKGAVPAFIFISGLTISYGYKNRELKMADFYKKRIKSIFIPYIAFTLFYYAVYIVVYNYEFSISYLINRILTGNMAYHLYFVIIIMQFYAIYPIINKILKKYNNNLVLMISAMIHIISYSYIPMKYRFFGNYMMYFMIGAYIAFNYDKVMNILQNKAVKKLSIITLIGWSIFYTIELYLEVHMGIKWNLIESSWQIFSLITIPGYYILSMWIDKNKNKFISNVKVLLDDISKVSFEVYLIHPFIILVLQKILSPISMTMRYMILTFVVLSLTILCAKIYKKIKSKSKSSLS